MGNLVEWICENWPFCRGPPRPENRTIYLGNHHDYFEHHKPQEKFCTNRVQSYKYHAWNFIPKNLFEQFQRIANFYFLCIGLIELVIDSPVSPVTSFLPLAFVIGVTMCKQGYEDWLRHKADNEVNCGLVSVVRDGELIQIKAMDIVVGDIVRVHANEGIPCDMVMLSSHDPDGECYITTANLDGETNLKTFLCLQETRHLQTEMQLYEFRANIECQQPITDLYRFVGRMNIHEARGETVTKSLGPENVMLRGSRLKNTPFIYGCAIYTGQETKMALNSKYKSTKFSRVEKSMNKYLIVFLCVLVFEAGLMTGLKHWFYGQGQNQNMWYTPPEKELSFLTVIEEFLAFMVLVNYVIPISLYVTVELQKFFGSMFFQWDREMYDAQINEPAKANTSDLNEELGQVEYLFTDKTGTLTENDMQFRQCAIGEVRCVDVGGNLCYKTDIPGVQPTVVKDYTDDMLRFFRVLVLCHTVHVDRKDNNGTGTYSETGFEYEYQASSPDEKAFVEACRRYGIIYHGVRDDRAEVSYAGQMKRYEVCHVLDFDPTRKRMSVIVRDEEGTGYILVKGAESAIFNHVIDGDKEAAEQHVNSYALLGLRTLVIAERKLEPEEFHRIDNNLKEAKKALENREEKLQHLYSQIEDQLTLLGATAVEDRLQDGVPETLEALREAGIKIWVLTGDKEETAVNISYSAGHFNQLMVEVRLTRCRTADEAKEKLSHLQRVLHDARREAQDRHALIVDGQSLALVTKDLRKDFLQVCTQCVTVLCCRLSPIQKAQIVKLVKEHADKPTTAAIGDGANDVSMIQEAHVGIGIMGKEGRQATRSSDYAFGRFCFLKRALLLHGHYFYVRIANLVTYFFYKNVAFITAQLYFQFIAAFSAQSIYDTFFLTFFNTAFTALPILLYGLFEQHIPRMTLMKKPELYRRIGRNSALSWGQFMKNNMLGLWHSLVVFFVPYLTFHYGEPMTTHGKMWGLYEHGCLIYTAIVIIANVKLMLDWYYWSGAAFFAFAFTFAIFFGSVFFYTAIIWTLFTDEHSFYMSFIEVMGQPITYFILMMCIVLALLPDVVLRAVRDTTSKIRSPRRKKISETAGTYKSRVDSVSRRVHKREDQNGGVPRDFDDEKKEYGAYVNPAYVPDMNDEGPRVHLPEGPNLNEESHKANNYKDQNANSHRSANHFYSNSAMNVSALPSSQGNVAYISTDTPLNETIVSTGVSNSAFHGSFDEADKLSGYSLSHLKSHESRNSQRFTAPNGATNSGIVLVSEAPRLTPSGSASIMSRNTVSTSNSDVIAENSEITPL